MSTEYYLLDPPTALQATHSSASGLSSAEATARLATDGKNKLVEPAHDSWGTRFIKALRDPMIYLLLGAAAISAVTTIYSNVAGDGQESYADVFIILFVVVLNTVLSVVQESKAEQAIEALTELTAETCRVHRDGANTTIRSEDLVTGDIVELEAGDAIPADCRILESHSLQVEEAALTGESAPVDKLVALLQLRPGAQTVPLAERANMVYAGSTVAYGRGRALVVATGMRTEMGKIADSLNQASAEETPLQKKLKELSITLTKIVVAICALVFVVGVVRDVLLSDTAAHVLELVLNTFIIAVALAVAAIPEGLPTVTTIVLSIGVTGMSKRNALVRRLTAVETLGCAQIICTDKTGTLTQNKMTVVDTATDDPTRLVTALALCNDAQRDRGQETSEGEPTERALVDYAATKQLYKNDLDAAYPRIGEVPFDSTRKLMSTLHTESGRVVQYTKGAIEVLLGRCTAQLRDGAVVPLTEAGRAELQAAAHGYASRALRVLAGAYRYHDAPPQEVTSDLEQGLTFIGFVGLMDPCRPEVHDAIVAAREAGIRPIMITGDALDTASAIASELGIISEADQAVLGAQLDELSDAELTEAVPKWSVYARVQPEHKTRIVRAWQARGMVTAMTGDGVNDAPSIKAADIGIGMGITGTAVTKSVADMVLADDNFATIVSAVGEGRKIYDNIHKVVQFQLATNFGEIVAIFTASMLGFHILSAAQLLWINLITDSFPGLALGMEPAESDLMRRKPRPVSESLFAGTGGFLIGQGVFTGLMVVAAYFFGAHAEFGSWGITQSVTGMTMAFLTCNFAEVFCAFATRSLQHSLFQLRSQNWWLLGALAFTSILTCAVVFIPAISGWFGLGALSATNTLIALTLAIAVIPASEVIKLIGRRRAHG